MLKARPATLLFEAANPRHEHEWIVWRDAKMPDDKMLAPGLIDTCSNYVEHPELIAQRIERYVAIVGADRVIAGTDCGFGTFAGYGKIDPDVTWKKLAALSEGARLAARGPRGGEAYFFGSCSSSSSCACVSARDVLERDRVLHQLRQPLTSSSCSMAFG